MDITYHTDDGILEIEPTGKLTEADFDELANELEESREHGLKGLLIHTRSFPGYNKAAAAIAHTKFVRDYRDDIERVAISTDSKLGPLAEFVGKMVPDITVKRFDYDNKNEAEEWLAKAA